MFKEAVLNDKLALIMKAIPVHFIAVTKYYPYKLPEMLRFW